MIFLLWLWGEKVEAELLHTGLEVDRIEPTEPPWVAQVYYLLQKSL